MSENNRDDDKTQTYVPLTKDTPVGHYRIIEKIGSGGMGEVYLADDAKLDRKVALKFLPPHLCQDEDCRARFKREAQAAAKLNHPNIVTVYDVSEFHTRPFFAMELIEGQSLTELLEGKELSIDRIIELAIQICDGLSAAHEKGIIHRDIKPSNIAIDSYGRPKILDFGLAAVKGGEQLTKTGSTLGTVGYMSPEQIEGKPADARSDLFSLGVLLYEMIAGRAPFMRDDHTATLKAIINDTPEPLVRYKTGVPDGLQNIVTKLLEKDPELRYQSARGILPDMKRLRHDSAAEFREAEDGKRRWSLMSIAMTLIAVLIIGYFAVDQWFLGTGGEGEALKRSGWTNSVAVLPFRDFSTAQDQEPFCDGMTDAIIGKLSGIPDLKVISMTSVMRYKSQDRDLKKIGKDLKVSAILEGSIQRENGAIRVRAQLINVKDDAHLWSEHYDRELKSVFAIQDDISRSIAEAMKVELLGTAETAMTHHGTDNVEAFSLYSQGRLLWNKRTEEDIRKSIEYFERAIELDSGYALAWAGLADAWAVLGGYSNLPDSVTIPKAREAAKKALALDDHCAEAYASMGLINGTDSSFVEAEQSFLRAIELNPGYAWSHIWYSTILKDNMGRLEDGIREENIAFELNPMSIPLIINRAYRMSDAGEFGEAEALYKRVIEIEPKNANSYWHYADHLKLMGQWEDAIKQLKIATECAPNFVGPHLGYIWTLYNMGRYEEAIRHAERATEIHQSAFAGLALVHDRMGNYDSALWAINKWVESDPGNQQVYYIKGQIFSNNGRLDSAMACFRKAYELSPEAYWNAIRLAEILLTKREYGRADSIFQNAVSHPDSIGRGWVRRRMVATLLHQGKFRDALTQLEENIKVDRTELGSSDPLYSEIQCQVFINLFFTGDYEAVFQKIDMGRKVLKEINPTNPDKASMATLKNVEANACILDGQSGRAERLLDELRSEMNSDDYGTLPVYRFWLGLAEYSQGNFDSAVVWFEKLLDIQSDFQNLQYLGMSYLGAGRIDNAVAALERSMNMYDFNRLRNPDFGVRGHYHLGQAYEAAGRIGEAISQYETFLDIWKNADPGLASVEDARSRLARLRSKS